MKTKGKYILSYLSIILITVIAVGTACSADKNKTIEGIVNDTYEIVTDDDEVYYITDNEKGEQIMDHVGQRVQATGIIKYDEDMDSNTITIEKFSVIEDEGAIEDEGDFDVIDDEEDFDIIDDEDNIDIVEEEDDEE